MLAVLAVLSDWVFTTAYITAIKVRILAESSALRLKEARQ